MAKCAEEFNPWPSFVDLFSSVILVLLLFMLVLLVNIGYYAQFKYKTRSEGSITDKIFLSPVASRVRTENIDKNITVSYKTIGEAPKVEQQAKQKQIFFEGNCTRSTGNAIARELSKNKSYSHQIVAQKEKELIIKFQDKEMFIRGTIISQIREFLNKYAKGRTKRVEIRAGDPTHVAGRTIARQISLGRVLNIKNEIVKFGVEKNLIKLNLKNTKEISHPFGFVIIKIVK